MTTNHKTVALFTCRSLPHIELWDPGYLSGVAVMLGIRWMNNRMDRGPSSWKLIWAWRKYIPTLDPKERPFQMYSSVRLIIESTCNFVSPLTKMCEGLGTSRCDTTFHNTESYAPSPLFTARELLSRVFT